MKNLTIDDLKNKTAENVLIYVILQNERNKRTYVRSKLSKFSRIMREIRQSGILMSDYLIKLHKQAFIDDMEISNLNDNEKSFLKNAIQTRYKNIKKEQYEKK